MNVSDTSGHLHEFGYCDFCRELSLNLIPPHYNTFGVPDTGRTVHKNEKFSVLADISPVTPGHLLLTTNDHYLSLADAIEEHGPVLAKSIIDYIRQYKIEYKNFAVIEHGTSSAVRHDGSCIDHAHWHIFPYPGNKLRPILESDLGMHHSILVDNLEDLPVKVSGDSYVLFWSANRLVVYPKVTPPHRQYARSVASRYLGYTSPVDWCWETSPKVNNLNATLSRYAETAISCCS